jgi:2-oxoglutarate ferredoxin oxidoreductase subunit alpha
MAVHWDRLGITMSTSAVSPRPTHSAVSQQKDTSDLPARPSRIVNDFSIQVATVNGSGSQTANNVLMRSIFQMGVPVSGKNMFPSNIAGLPTWFTIRANKNGYIGRKKEVDFLVAMNPETAQEDVLKLDPGAAVLYDEPLKLNELRSDLHFYPVPFDRLVGPVCPEAKLRKLVKNMLYPGVLAHLLGIELEEMRRALFKQFGPRKKKAAELGEEPAQERSLRGRADGSEPGKADRRWQLGCRAGMRFRRRYGAYVVSHHPLVLAR